MGDGTHQLAYLVAFFIAQDYKNHENIAGLLTYDVATHNMSPESIPSQKPLKKFPMDLCLLIKYSNGGCSGLEPDSLSIYSVYNFSNYIFKYIIFLNQGIMKKIKCQEEFHATVLGIFAKETGI